MKHISRSRPGWTRIQNGVYSGCGAVYRFTNGATVTHCGHGTALYPYVGELTNGRAPRMIAERDMPNKIKKGQPFLPKFTYLDECQRWMEGEWRRESCNKNLDRK